MKSSKSRPLFSRASLMVAAALLAVGTPKPAKAANLTWNQANNNTYSWINSANWSGGTGYPDAIGDVANLNVNILGTNTITLDTNVTLAALNIGDATGGDAFIIQSGVVAQPGILPLAGQSVNVGAGSIVMDALGNAPVTITKSGTGVTDEISALVYFNDALTITATGKVRFSGGLRSGQSEIVIAGAGEVEVSAGGFITGGNLVKNDAGIFRLGSTSSHSGATTINAGSLVANAANVLPNRTALTVAAGATLNLNNNSQVIGSLAGAGLVTNPGGTATTLTIGRADTSSTFSGQFTSTTAAANLLLTKQGSGVFTFSPSVASTYTGATTVQGGAFVLDFANSGALQSLLAATPVTIQSGRFTMVGRAGLASSQTLGGFTAGQGGGVLSVVAGDTSLTRLALGGLTVSTSSTAGSSLLVSAPANTQITTTTARPAENIYGNGR
ncbi:MAG: autotransporter-associated beta strand repeat-containing protein, partial [Opitutales bacterium]